MNTMYERLLRSTEDLLYRVRIYDRNLTRSEEITQLDEAYGLMSTALLRSQGSDDHSMEYLASRLQQVRLRLITMMEDLLHPA
ncbi:hypothetical protein [Paenibacillus sp. CF384]|uniref:hypothetical protein n=1 Tax=Paenibacillus sp. CF384 TaxID=1884382 RepID=UPI0008981715|nr:hypothetical protein [Paenibacillus sp. CF384]SDW86094.1 hypothetical protein SAMN05518855_100646 [Paenibacillus sp. CF384]